MPCMQDVPLRGRRRVITSVRTRKVVPLFELAFAVQAFVAALAFDRPSFVHPSFVRVA